MRERGDAKTAQGEIWSLLKFPHLLRDGGNRRNSPIANDLYYRAVPSIEVKGERTDGNRTLFIGKVQVYTILKRMVSKVCCRPYY